MRKGWGSRTAVWVSAWRGLGRFFPEELAHDPVAKDLVGAPYRQLLELAERRPRTARAIVRGLEIATGGLARHLPMRTRAIDEALEEEVSRGTRQIVLLGAGLDARAHRLDALRDCTVFEIDHPDTQAIKRSVVLEPIVKDVRYVAVDFERDDLERALASADHDPSKPSAVVWEGVTMYLERPAIEATLSTLSRVCANGSCVLVTYYDTKAMPGANLVRPVFRLIGEPLRTQIEREEMRALVSRHGFERVLDEGDEEWTERFLGKRAIASMSERLIWARK